MKHFFRKVWGLEYDRKKKAVPAFAGGTVQEVLMWAAKHGMFEQLVAAANEGEPRRMVTAEEREAELRAAGKLPPSAEAPQQVPPQPPDPASPETPEAKRPLAYWEEKCRWRHREAADYAWDGESEPGYMCEYEYDVLERAWG
jgi:hypothetical protein